MDARQDQARESKPSEKGPNKAQGKLVWEHRLLWILLIAFLSLWGYHYAMGHVDRQLRIKILRKLNDRFPDHFVQLDHAHLQEGHAILLEGLQVALPTSEGPRDILRIQRIVAHGPLHLLELMRDHVPIEKVQIEGLELSVWPTDASLWSLQTLSSEDPLPGNLPTVDIRSGLIRLGQQRIDDGELIFHDLRARLRTIPEGAVEVDASVHGGFFQKLRTQLSLSLDKKSFQVSGELVDCECSERLLSKLPQPLQKIAQEANGLNCRTSAQFQASRTLDGKIDFDLRGDFRNGRLVHQRVPYLLENLQGEIYCKSDLIQLRNVSATNGAARFQVEADIANPLEKPSCVINVQVHSLSLDQRLYQAIPQSLQSHWQKLAVSGVVDASVRLSYDGYVWSPDATVQCRSVNATPDIFPYPVQDIQGSFRFHNNVLFGEKISGTADGRKVTGSIRLEKASPKWLMDLQMSTEEWVGIDQKLLAALTPLGEETSKLEQFVRSLSPNGLVQLRHARFLRSAENPTKLMKWLELGFHSGSIRYSGFSYPIFDIRGNVIVDNEVVLLKDLEGRNDSARIRCQGRCVSGAGSVDELRLSFDSQSVPLEEELQRALPAPVRELWNQLQPSGVLDNVQVTLERSHSAQPLDVQVEISEAGLIDSQIGRSVSLRPIAIPYLLNDISCHIVYRPGVVDVLQMSGYHDSSHLKAEGTCRMQESGQWSGVLNWLPQSRVIVDQSLLAALPEKLRQPLVTLDFRGPVNVGGWTYFMTDAKGGQPFAQSWDLDLDIEEGRLRGGSIASGIRGTVQLKGEMTERGPMVVGHFGIDSLAIRSIPVMGLRGKFAIDGEKLLFGRDAVGVILPNSPKMNFSQSALSNSVQPASAQSPLAASHSVPALSNTTNPSSQTSQALWDDYQLPEKAKLAPNIPWEAASARTSSSQNEDPTSMVPADGDIQAKTLSGRLHAYGAGNLSTGRLQLQVHLVDADFQNLLLEVGQSSTPVSGRVFADARLQGSLHNINTLSGGGVIRVRDADLYELPMMAKVFRVLSVRPPDDGAFETADVEFQIDGDRFPLQKIALDGDVISLKGTGWTNMRKELHLDLYTYVGRRGQLAAMFGPLLSGNDSATLLRLAVDGTLDNPKVERSFPVLEMTMEQVFPEKVAELPITSPAK